MSESKTVLERRLAALRSEYETGQKMLADLEARRQQLGQTLLRMEGAMEVLKEVMTEQAGMARDAKK